MINDFSKSYKNYRLNKFVIKVATTDGQILYNSLTGGIVFVNDEDDLSKSFEELKKMKFYVPCNFDEISWVNELREKKKHSQERITRFKILTTTDCNARCYYCYEKGQSKITMTEKNANDIVDYILRVSKKSPIVLGWFVGEPLYNSNVINIICKSLLNKGVKFKSTMISNGLLFTDSIILKAKKLWNLKNVQITLDGMKQVYQKAKAYKDAQGNEFDRVIDNIGKIINVGIRVSIRLNQNLNNTEDLIELSDFLQTKFGNNNLVSVYNHWLFGEDGSDSDLEPVKYNKFKQLQNKLIECGLFHNYSLKESLRFCHCMADNDSSVLISPKGKLGKCEHFSDQHFIGSIYETTLNNEEITKWKEKYPPTPKCYDCPLYPQCYRIKMCPLETDNCTIVKCENRIELIKKALIQKYYSMSKGSKNAT
ncbi:MAG: radical SAM protein [Bacteroidaceae bacterium]|nr:radical SAM protein [Bacteroidaceae bacterium]